VTTRELLKEELLKDCQLATELAQYAADLRRRADAADKVREALDLPASYQLRRRMFRPTERTDR
jgi:hypothetical protein